MEMKKNISLLLCMLVLIVSCTKETLLDTPRDENGNVILTEVSTATTTGISTLDTEFSVNATVPNAKPGDAMIVECLQLQIPPSGGDSKQLLPLAGTQKTVTVGDDRTVSVSYSRTEANLNMAGDYVAVTFAGETDYAMKRVDMVTASRTTRPKVAEIEVDITRSDETAYFNVTVEPKSGAYTGTLVAKRKNGINDGFVDVSGSPFSGEQPFLVPILGTDFAEGKDTMYYSFIAERGGHTDEIETSVIVRDPYFYLKKSATLTLGSETAEGRNLLINAAVAENDNNAMVALSDALHLQGGSAWLGAGNTIEFVPSTLAMYTANKSNDAINAFETGEKSTTVAPTAGEGVYIFKAVTGSEPEDVYYGMIQVNNVFPGISVTFEYRIGNMYAHLAVIQ